MSARRRPRSPSGRQRRNPSLRQIGRALTAPVRGYRRAGEWATGYQATMSRPVGAKAEPTRRTTAPDAGKAEHEERMRHLRETKEMRAAAILWHRQEYYRARADAERAKAERARSAEVRRSSEGKAATAAKKADEFAEMTRKAEAGQLSPEQLRYYINAYGQTGRKRK